MENKATKWKAANRRLWGQKPTQSSTEDNDDVVSPQLRDQIPSDPFYPVIPQVRYWTFAGNHL